MNWDDLKKNWTDWEPKIKTHWDKLTNGDLESLGSDREQLAVKIRDRYKISIEDAEAQVTVWLCALQPNDKPRIS